MNLLNCENVEGYEYMAIDSEAVAVRLITECLQNGWVSYDIETTGLDIGPETYIRTIAFCTGYPNRRYVHILGDYKCSHSQENECIDDSSVSFIQNKEERDKITKLLLKNILNDAAIAKIGWNIKFDNLHIQSYTGIEVMGEMYDGSVIKKLITPHSQSNGLKDTTEEMLHESYHKYEDAVYQHLNGKKATKKSIGELFRTIPATELCGYNAIDTEVTYLITHYYMEILNQLPQTFKLYKKIVSPLIRALTRMEYEGLHIDLIQTDKAIEEMNREIEICLKEINSHRIVKEFVHNRYKVDKSYFLEKNKEKASELIKNFYSARAINDSKLEDRTKKKITTLCNSRRKMLRELNLSSPKQLGEFLYSAYGLNLDKKNSSDEIDDVNATIDETLYEYAGKKHESANNKNKEIDYGAWGHLTAWLGDENLKTKSEEVKSEQTTATGQRKTDVNAIKKLDLSGSDFPEFINLLLKYRGMNKALSTYLSVFKDKTITYSEKDTRIHGTFRIGGTETGRLSSANPNLQNIPRAGTNTGTLIKSCISAPEGYKLMQIDFSQMELRMLALLSSDPNMMEIYRKGEDLHKFAAMSILGVNDRQWEEIDGKKKKQARTQAKAVNFGYMYGMGAKKFREYAENNYGAVFTEEEAETLQTKFFTAFPNIVKYYTQLTQMCYTYLDEFRQIPVSYNIFGRHRFLLNKSFKEINRMPAKEKERYISQACRNAINTVVQSSCADIVMLFIVDIHKAIEKLNKIENEKPIKLVNTVHDSVLIYCPENRINQVYTLAKKLIYKPNWIERFGIPFEIDFIFDIDFEVGDNWANLKEYKP